MYAIRRVKRKQFTIRPGDTITVINARHWPDSRTVFVVSVAEVVGRDGTHTDLKVFGYPREDASPRP